MTLSARLWAAAAALAPPLLALHLRRRAAGGREVAARLPERRGEGAARPPGRLLWLHAASVGETLAVLPVLDALAARAPDLHILFTTGTVTSAALLVDRLPPAIARRTTHRFAPLDVPAWCDRFLDGWRPDAGAFVESEIWPNLLAAARRRGLPLALINARLSPRSARGWARAPGFARELLGGFAFVLARTPADAASLAALGAPAARLVGDLKLAAPPLPADPAALAALRDAIGARPVLLAASTHPGEEALVLAAHRAIALDGLLTILVPRHPDRGPAIAALAAGASLPATRRAAGALPDPHTPVHVADTLGELGLFYRVAQVALVGGSLVPHGGQNPVEPARLGCPILLGPHTGNFADVVDRLLAAGGAARVEADSLAGTARALLSDPARAAAMARAATAALADAADLPDRVAQALLELLP